MNRNNSSKLGKFKPILIKVLIILLIDVILLSAFVWWVDATPDVSIAELLIIPFIITVNLAIAACFRYIFKNKSRATMFLINAFLAAFIFHWLFYLWFVCYDKMNFKFYYFTHNNKYYEVIIDKRDTSYAFLERYNSGSASEFKKGKYKVDKNHLTLFDSTKQMIIHNNKLFGSLYGDSISLSNDTK